MIPCDSRPNFELWVLLHYEKLQPRPYRIADMAQKLSKHLGNYVKGDGLFSALRDRMEPALSNADHLRKSPDREENDCFTNADELVRHFIREFPEDGL